MSGGLPDRAGTGPAFSDAFFSRELSRFFHLPCAVSYTGGPGCVRGKNDGLGDDGKIHKENVADTFQKMTCIITIYLLL